MPTKKKPAAVSNKYLLIYTDEEGDHIPYVSPKGSLVFTSTEDLCTAMHDAGILLTEIKNFRLFEVQEIGFEYTPPKLSKDSFTLKQKP